MQPLQVNVGEVESARALMNQTGGDINTEFMKIYNVITSLKGPQWEGSGARQAVDMQGQFERINASLTATLEKLAGDVGLGAHDIAEADVSASSAISQSADGSQNMNRMFT